MTRHRIANLFLAAAGIAVWLLLNAALDGPSDAQALQDTATAASQFPINAIEDTP